MHSHTHILFTLATTELNTHPHNSYGSQVGCSNTTSVTPQTGMLGKNRVLIFINPKYKVYRWVLGVSSAGNCVFNYQSSLERINLGEINGEEEEN